MLWDETSKRLFRRALLGFVSRQQAEEYLQASEVRNICKKYLQEIFARNICKEQFAKQISKNNLQGTICKKKEQFVKKNNLQASEERDVSGHKRKPAEEEKNGDIWNLCILRLVFQSAAKTRILYSAALFEDKFQIHLN